MDLDGVFDLHVHPAPDLFPRLGDDTDFARRCHEAGMAGFAIKSHHESTVGRAHHVRQAVPGFEAIGGITLNRYVGGFNPVAVEQSLRLGGRVVWGPSGHANYHEQVTGELGGWEKQEMRMGTTPHVEPVTATRPEGGLHEETIEILALVADHSALFCTSHLSPKEIELVLEASRGLGTRVLLNHAFYFPRTDKDFVLHAYELGAFIEVCAAVVFPYWQLNTYEQVVDLLANLDPHRSVIASDCGGIHTPWPHEALSTYGDELLARGVPPSDLVAMMNVVPAALAAGAGL